MEYLSFSVVMLFFVGIMGMIGLVIAAGRGEILQLVFFFLGTVFLFFIAGHEAFNQGVLEERTLNPSHNYIVKVKKQSNVGMPLIVYDMTEKKDHIIDIEGYPPSGFSEVLTADGKTMLIPVSK